MKTAADYAKQASRFAIRAGVDAEQLEDNTREAYREGKRAGREVGEGLRQIYCDDARVHAMLAARHARFARAGGQRKKAHIECATFDAIQAALCAGYAAGV